jgi:hypothetical protein
MEERDEMADGFGREESTLGLRLWLTRDNGRPFGGRPRGMESAPVEELSMGQVEEALAYSTTHSARTSCRRCAPAACPPCVRL